MQLQIKGDDGKDLLELNDAEQSMLDSTPQISLLFKNKRTFWKYINKFPEGTLITKEKQWLTERSLNGIDSSDFDLGDISPPDLELENLTFPRPDRTSYTKKEGNNNYSEIHI